MCRHARVLRRWFSWPFSVQPAAITRAGPTFGTRKYWPADTTCAQLRTARPSIKVYRGGFRPAFQPPINRSLRPTLVVSARLSEPDLSLITSRCKDLSRSVGCGYYYVTRIEVPYRTYPVALLPPLEGDY